VNEIDLRNIAENVRLLREIAKTQEKRLSVWERVKILFGIREGKGKNE